MVFLKHPIHEFGYVRNNPTIVDDLRQLVVSNDEITFATINKSLVDAQANSTVVYWDKFGNESDPSLAIYALFPTGLSSKETAQMVYGLYARGKQNNWVGIEFRTMDQVRDQISRSNRFTIGDTRYGAYIVFDSDWYAGLDFLKDLAATAIEERWGYETEEKSVLAPYRIMISYLGTVLIRAKRQNRLLVNDRSDRAIFNTGLLDRYFEPLFLLCELRKVGSEQKYELANPVRIQRIRDITIKYGFRINGGQTVREKDLPRKATFFEAFDDIFFRTDLDIDLDLQTYEHIVRDRVNRMPAEFRNKPPQEVAMQVKSAIRFAVAMAELNYKFIVPQYRPETDSIQFLMPLYLKQKFEATPDVALVLRRDGDFYVPETILTLDWAYQNSRVIAKPDETWLDPARIAVTDDLRVVASDDVSATGTQGETTLS